MPLSDINLHSRCVINSLKTEGELKARLMSFGIIPGNEMIVTNKAFGKSTIAVKVGKMRLALRKKEAESIEVTCL